MIKLFVIAPQNPYPPKDGGKIGIYYPLIHLAKFFEIHFVFLTSQNVSVEVYAHFKEYNISIYPQIANTKDTLFGYLLNFKNELPYKFQKYCSTSILKNILEICRKEKIKNVWCNHAHVAWYALELKKRIGTNIYLREHNIEFMLVQQVMHLKKGLMVKAFIRYQYLKTKRFEQKCWNQFEKTFFISDSDFAIATKNSDKKHYKLLYDSFGGYRRSVTIEREPYSFIFTANLETFQNLYNLQKFVIDIWQPLIARDNRWKLYVTGNKPGIVQTKLRIDLIANNIVDLGFVKDVHEVIGSKKYFISPTYIGSGIRIKVLNALVGGAFCFVTQIDLEMLKELQDDFNIIKFVKFEDFYSKLLLYEADEALYMSIIKRAQEVGSTHSWERYAEIVYNEVETESTTSR